MAQLKDSIVQGNLRVTDEVLTDTLQATKIEVPTTSGGTTYGVGTNGQVIKSNGTTVYWANDNNSGDVTGPSSATVNAIAAFNNANGKVIKDSGYTFSTGSTDTTATHVVLCNDSRLSNARTPSSHTHGNIQNGGTLQTNDITIASGDKLVVTDSSDSSKVARTSISFDGSTATKCLTQKGTWESFSNNSGTITSVKTTAGTHTAIDVSSGAVAFNVPTKTSHLTNDSGYTTNTGTITGVSVNGTSVATSGVANITSVPASILTGAIANGVTATTQSARDNSTKVATTAYVDTAIDNLPEPMIFKGTLGTGGTITTLPTAASSNEGFTYKVITAGTYASQSAKVGDVFVSTGSAWVIIPAGDTDSDTWRGIKVNGTDLLGNAISTGAVNFKNGTNVTVSGSGNDIQFSATNTTYTLGTSNNNITLTPSSGTAQSITAPYATSAGALTTNAGSSLNPVYFSSGVPVASLGNSIPFIVGTGSTAGTWLGTLEGLTAYYDGLLILYKPSVAGASTTTLNLNDIGAKTCYINSTSKLTTHYPANQPILLVYSSSQNSGCFMALDNYDSNSNTYDRNKYVGTVKAGATAIAKYNIIVADSNNLYHQLNDGTTFDIKNPILYANSAISANSTGSDNYDILAITITTTQSITLTPYAPVFIEGTLSGTTFTPVSTTPLTQTIPTTADGKCYMLLGVAYSATAIYLTEDHRVFAFKNGVFGEIVNDAMSVNGHTVATDVPSNAVFTDHYAWGDITSKPTTISGYGITDAKIASGTITLGSNTITPLTSSSTLDATKLSGTIPSGCYTDTKNTAGSTDSSSKLFLVGATSQTASSQTYSQDTAYVGTDGHLYSNSKQVVNLSDSQALTNKTYNGYTLAAACAKAVVTSVDTSASLPTSNAVKTFVEGKGYVTTDTKNTAGATTSTEELYLVGATATGANPQTYTDGIITAKQGALKTTTTSVGNGACTLTYNSTTESVSFIFS